YRVSDNCDLAPALVAGAFFCALANLGRWAIRSLRMRIAFVIVRDNRSGRLRLVPEWPGTAEPFVPELHNRAPAKACLASFVLGSGLGDRHHAQNGGCC